MWKEKATGETESPGACHHGSGQASQNAQGKISPCAWAGLGSWDLILWFLPADTQLSLNPALSQNNLNSVILPTVVEDTQQSIFR